MNKNNLIGQKIITKDGSTLEIVEVEDSNNLKEIVIKTSNKKMFNIYLGYKNGFIKFVDESLNEELNEYIKNENIELQRLKDLEEEKRRLVLERERKEKERLENAISLFRGEYLFLSNFYEVDVTYEGFTYKNNEAAFQAQKDLSRRSEFVDINPVSAKRLGKRVNLRSDWEKVKVDIMTQIVRCKFDQHPDLKQKLIDTGDRLLIEGNTWNDKFWGVCKGVGLNKLGEILMKIRKEYMDHKEL